MRRTLIVLLLGLMASIPLLHANGQSGDAERRARFLAAHPVLSKIKSPSQSTDVTTRLIKAPAQGTRSRNAVAKAAALPHGLCNVVSSNAWSGRFTAYGMYSFGPASGFTLTPLHTGTTKQMVGNGGAVKIGNKYYVQYWYMGPGFIVSYLTVWNTDTWEVISHTETDDGGLQASDMAYDRINNVCYAATFRDDLSGWELCKIDFTKPTPRKTSIGNLPLMVVALAVDSKGKLYGIFEDGVLYDLNTSTAAMTRIGDTGVKVGGYNGVTQQSGAIDQHTDTFWWAARDIYGNATLYTVDTTTAEVRKVSDIPDKAGMLNMQFLAPSAPDKAPNFIEDLAAEFTGGSHQGTVTFTTPSDTYDGSQLGSDLNYSISINGEVKATGKTAAGQKVTETVTATDGMATVEAWVENGEGRSPVATTEIWVGEDFPIMKQVEYKAEGRKSTISWSINEKGLHNGWLGNVTYNVTRLPDNVTVAIDTSQTTITDEIPADAPLTKFTYSVTPVNGSRTGEAMLSNSNIVGGALEPPYFQPFEDSSSFDTMVVLDQNKDKTTWHWSEQNMFNTNGLASLDSGMSDFGIEVDDWLLTPVLKFEAGNTYTLSFKALSTEVNHPVVLDVCYGPDLDVAKYKKAMESLKMTFSNVLQDFEATITSDKDQMVRIGFHVKAYDFMSNMKVDDIRISAKANGDSPDKCNSFTVEPAADGALKATVKLTAPDKDRNGKPLASLTKINIYCGNDIVKTLDNPEPGKAYEQTVKVASNGEHTFAVEAINESGASESVKATIFVGVDIPGNFNVYLEDKGDCLILSWDECKEGANGHFINKEDITYDIYQVAGTQSLLLKEDVTGTSVTIPLNTDEGKMGMLQLAVRAKNSAGTSKYQRSQTLIVGEPYKLPYEEHFAGQSTYIYTGDMDQMFDITEGMSSDGDDNAFVWMMLNPKQKTMSLETLKIKVDGTNPVLSFDYATMDDAGLEVDVLTPDGNVKTLTSLKPGSAVSGWLRCTLGLGEYAKERYIRIIFRFMANNTAVGFTAIDNLLISDVVEYDLAIDNITVPSTATAYNEHANIGVVVTGKGINTSDPYTVSLYADDALVGTESADGLDFMRSNTIYFNYEVKPGMPETINLRAELTSERDEVASNNTATAVLNVAEAKVSAPENLRGNESDSRMELTWDAPSEFYTENVYEDFETYTPWTISNFGKWTVWDLDGGNVIRLGEVEYPNQGVPQAFTVFNPISIGVPDSNPEARPHSGYQYLVCFAAKIMEVSSNDDWLVSPLLPGTAQTIKFYAKQMITSYGPEKIEVLYSTDKQERDDFILAKELVIDNSDKWKKCEVELPEGAKYFAIRVVTSDGHMCMIDDVSFTAGSCTEIVSWNVYRNNTLLANVPANTLNYVDENRTAQYKYNVTAVYATGEESAYSNDVTNCAGMPDITDNVKSYDVYSIDGKIIRLNATDLDDLDAGLYIVNGKKMIIR